MSVEDIRLVYRYEFLPEDAYHVTGNDLNGAVTC